MKKPIKVGDRVHHPKGHGRVLSVHRHEVFYGISHPTGVIFQPASRIDPDNDGDNDVPGGNDPDNDPVAQTLEGLMFTTSEKDGKWIVTDSDGGKRGTFPTEVSAKVAADTLNLLGGSVPSTWDTFHDFSADEMRKMGSAGQAFKKDDGTYAYPTPNLVSWHKAQQAFGRSDPKERGRLKSYLISRGKSLGAPAEEVARISEYKSS